MPFPLSFESTVPPSQDPSSSLRLPAQRRISIPSSHRLNVITEGPRPANASGSLLQPRSILRNSVGSSQAASTRTAPPPYTWRAEPQNGDVGPVEGDELAELRRKEGYKDVRRGGWGRFAVIAIAVVAVIALAVGLGVGLTVGKRKNPEASTSTVGDSGSQISGDGSGTGTTQPFPLGEWSFVTSLRTVTTDCTSNAATWRCYPYSVFDASNAATNTSSLATFNWVIRNTSSEYATNTTGLGTDLTAPANLTISSTNNPFALSFSDLSLTYLSDAGINSSPRYTFSTTLPKMVVPSPAITPDNTASQCYFNNTVLSGSLYLAASRLFPSSDQMSSTSSGGYTQWPYAVEISQTSAGGQGVPDCYETVNGAIGQRVVNGLDPQAANKECVCRYRNY